MDHVDISCVRSQNKNDMSCQEKVEEVEEEEEEEEEEDSWAGCPLSQRPLFKPEFQHL